MIERARQRTSGTISPVSFILISWRANHALSRLVTCSICFVSGSGVLRVTTSRNSLVRLLILDPRWPTTWTHLDVGRCAGHCSISDLVLVVVLVGPGPVSKNCRYCSIASITPVCSRQGASLRVLGCLMFHSKRSVRTTERWVSNACFVAYTGCTMLLNPRHRVAFQFRSSSKT